MNVLGKLENTMREVHRHDMQCLALTEMRYTGQDDFTQDGVGVMYSGGKTRHKGVALLLSKRPHS